MVKLSLQCIRRGLGWGGVHFRSWCRRHYMYPTQSLLLWSKFPNLIYKRNIDSNFCLIIASLSSEYFSSLRKKDYGITIVTKNKNSCGHIVVWISFFSSPARNSFQFISVFQFHFQITLASRGSLTNPNFDCFSPSTPSFVSYHVVLAHSFPLDHFCFLGSFTVEGMIS